MEIGLVRPLEIKRVAERLPYPPIVEQGAPGVEDHGAHSGGPAVGQHLELDSPVGDGGDVIRRRPKLGVGLAANVGLAGLEGLEGHGGVAIVVIADFIEVVLAAIDRQAGAPVVVQAAVDNGAAGIDPGDPVGPAAEGRLERRLGEVGFAVVGLREYRHEAHDERHLAIGVGAEDKLHRPGAGTLDPRDPRIVQPMVRASLVAQGLERKYHVIDGDRRAVVKTRLGPQGESDPRAVVGDLDGLGDQPVEREGLVPCALEQALEDVLTAGWGHPLDDIRIERIETAGDRHAQDAALGSVRIDIIEIAEVGAVFRRPVHGDSIMGAFAGLGP